jgi:hypothetical protein
MFALAAACLVFASGCGGGAPKDAPNLGHVTGTVKLDGAPLSGANVVFTHTDGRSALGVTDASGKYEPSYSTAKGAVVGENTVRITWTPAREHDEAGNVKETGKELPAKYNTESTLKATVKTGENTFDFDLTSN